MNFVYEDEIPKPFKEKYVEVLKKTTLRGKNASYITPKKFKESSTSWVVDYQNECFLADVAHGERELAQILGLFIFYWHHEFFYIITCKEILDLNSSPRIINYYQISCDLLSEILLEKEVFLQDLKQAITIYSIKSRPTSINYFINFEKTKIKGSYHSSLIGLNLV